MAQTRNHSLDLMRVLAAFGIIWAHMQAPFMEIGYLALALFTILTTVMAMGSARTRGFGRFMRGRFWRIFLPWLAWCGLYLLLDAAREGDVARLWRLTDWQSLLVGPAVHLWFLPFVILSAPLAFWATRLLTERRKVWAAVFPLGLLGASALAMHDNAQMDAPWAQWCSVTIPFFYGILSQAARQHGPSFAPIVFVLFATLLPIVFWDSQPAWFFLAAALVFELCWRIRIDAPWLARLGALSFGIYLVHPFMLLVWYKLAGEQMPRSIGAVGVFLGSLVMAAVIEVVWARILPRRRAGEGRQARAPESPVLSPAVPDARA